MQTIHLKFPDRATALTVLGATLGFASMADVPGGPEPVTAGLHGVTRYDLCFLGDLGLVAQSEGAERSDLINLLWWGSTAELDAMVSGSLSAHVVEPLTPTCVFAP